MGGDTSNVMVCYVGGDTSNVMVCYVGGDTSNVMVCYVVDIRRVVILPHEVVTKPSFVA